MKKLFIAFAMLLSMAACAQNKLMALCELKPYCIDGTT